LKGVKYDKIRKKYVATISIGGKRLFLGRFGQRKLAEIHRSIANDWLKIKQQEAIKLIKEI